MSFILVKMKQSNFQGLDDRALIWACVDPFIQRVRGKDLQVKAEVFLELTPGQQGLMLFQIFYGHSKSAAEFYWFACEYLSKPKLWEKMKDSLRFYGCEKLMNVYSKIEEELGPVAALAQSKETPVSVMDLDRDGRLLRAVQRLSETYRQAAGEAFPVIAAHIRSNPEQYVLIES